MVSHQSQVHQNVPSNRSFTSSFSLSFKMAATDAEFWASLEANFSGQHACALEAETSEIYLTQYKPFIGDDKIHFLEWPSPLTDGGNRILWHSIMMLGGRWHLVFNKANSSLIVDRRQSASNNCSSKTRESYETSLNSCWTKIMR